MNVEDDKLYKILIGKPEWKRTLGRAVYRWQDIRTNLKEVENEYRLGSSGSNFVYL
jgi:hypothetical protein